MPVHYWNMGLSRLQCDFLWATDANALSDETNSLLLFFNYLSVRMSDRPTYNKIKGKLISIKPQFVSRGEDLFDKHMKHHAELLDKAIDETIDKNCSRDIPFYGFSANLHQWDSGNWGAYVTGGKGELSAGEFHANFESNCFN